MTIVMHWEAFAQVKVSWLPTMEWWKSSSSKHQVMGLLIVSSGESYVVGGHGYF
jgi:hypothetical protein